MTDYKSMFEQAVRTLAAIDEALGIGDDGSSDIDEDEAGWLFGHLKQSIWITLHAPEEKPEAIDGSVEAFRKDHPDATDLFAAGSPDDFDGDDSEGGGADVGREEEAA